MIGYLIEQMEREFVKSDTKIRYFKREFEYKNIRHHIYPWWRFDKSPNIYVVL